MFGGPLGTFAAKAMEKHNVDAEIEAIETLAPAANHAVLAVGFGPGVGVERLLSRVPDGWVGGVDPSQTMVNRARRRNAEAAASGRAVLKRADSTAIPWPDAAFDGAISVNAIQFWHPLSTSAAEVARVLQPGAKLVTFTHDWALTKGAGASVEEWAESTAETLRDAGFDDVAHWRGRAEDGRSYALTAVRHS